MGQQTGQMERISYIDGLRGVAVALVVLYHLRLYMNPSWIHGPLVPWNWAVTYGYEGVALFFVLSGLCLSLPLLQRREQSAIAWLVPSEFFARRSLRIVPPYYAALILSLIVTSRFVPGRFSAEQPVQGAGDLLSHLLLLHNMTAYHNSINGVFWSLGLEWQWYLAFPIVLVLAVRRPLMALAGTFALASAWHCLAHDLGSYFVLPPALCEFACGIGVAILLTKGYRPHRGLLSAVVIGSVLLASMPWPTVASTVRHAYLLNHVLRLPEILGIAQPFYAVGFAACVLLVATTPLLRAALAWRPLVWLGLISYSVYLLHLPTLELVAGMEKPASVYVQRSPLLMAGGVATAIVVSWLFHLAVERPCLDKRIRESWEPRLARLFRWTDRLWSAGERVARCPAPLCVPIEEPVADMRR
jgi:peptidoglycan/LPS O-acetylase OafA/YrhL